MKNGDFLFWAKNRMISEMFLPHFSTYNSKRCSNLQNRLLHGLKHFQGLVGCFWYCSIQWEVPVWSTRFLRGILCLFHWWGWIGSQWVSQSRIISSAHLSLFALMGQRPWCVISGSRAGQGRERRTLVQLHKLLKSPLTVHGPCLSSCPCCYTVILNTLG